MGYQTNKKWVFTINNSLRDFTTINNPKVFTTTNSPDFTTNNNNLKVSITKKNNLKDFTTTSSHRDSTMNKRDSTTIRKIKEDARRRAENNKKITPLLTLLLPGRSLRSQRLSWKLLKRLLLPRFLLL